MFLPDLCIKRPVFATVLSLLVVLVGIICYDRLSLREYPKIDEPIVTVDTRYPGASAEIVESQITKPLEDSLSGIEGIEFMTSVSRAERSQITVHFTVSRDTDAAANDVRDRTARVRDALPDEIDEPIVSKTEADAEAIIYLAFSSDRHSPLDVTDFADRVVKDRLATLPGVADVPIFGERRYAMRIWLDPARLAAFRLTPQDVEDALRRQNVEVPSGRIESERREFTVLAETDLRTPDQFEDIILNNAGGYLVRLGDVGRAEIDAEDDRVVARYNGRSAVALGVVKQSTANPLEVSAAVRAALPEVQRQLPAGMEVEIAYDSSEFIARSINEVFTTIAEAIVLVIVVIFLFLRSFRATLIPLVTIPVSLVGSFALIYAFGFSVNTLTLLALVLAIGLVVDDAIVVLENIFRHIEEGVPPLRAAFIGVREIGFAVVAMSLTLAAVFAPFAFATGRTDKLFTEFALTLAGAVLISGFVALTLSPMMCSRMLRHAAKHGWLYNLFERGIGGLTRGYRRALTAVLRARFAVVVVFLGLVASAGYLVFFSLKSELAPSEDRGFIIGIFIAPEGATIASVDTDVRRIEALYEALPEKEKYFTVIGFPVVSQGISFLGTVDWDERERGVGELVAELGPQMFGIPGLLAFPVIPPSLGGGVTGQQVEFVVQTTGTYEELQALTNKLLAEVSKNPGIVNPDTDLKLNKPEIKVRVNREKAADLGIPIETIGRTLETLLGGRQVTRFKLQGDQYDVIVKVDNEGRTTPQSLAQIYMRGQNGNMVELANLISYEEAVAPRELNHFDKLRAMTLSANLAPGYSLGEALSYLESAVQRVATADVQIDYGGVSREFKQSSTSILWLFLLAVGFIYLMLAAQFESFVDPLIILLSAMPAITGALLVLDQTDGTLNVYTKIGLITLIGLITKHGILIVEFANQLREKGRDRLEAAIEAATLRLRPILMTTGAMVLGALPLAVAEGAGAEARRQIGQVIVGGMTFGTFFTLFVVPTAYTLLAGRRPALEAAEAERRRAHGEPAAAE
ncbi:MAG: efflux RND transporter permease subunit [Dongiaceae bacterium]